MSSRRVRVGVVGAGVVGLTVARTLEERGAEVRVVAATSGLDESSGAAGAVWFPYGPEFAAQQERVNAWARVTHEWLSKLAAGEPNAGVDAVLPTWFSVDDREPPPWAGALPADAALEWVDAGALPAPLLAHGAKPHGAWRFPAPVVHPARHLAWLEAGIAHEIERRTVEELDEVEGDVVVNCAGCGAREVAKDSTLVPRVGQTVVASHGELPRDCVLMDDRDESSIFYSIARGPGGAEVVLCVYDVADGAAETARPSGAVTRDILERHGRAGIVAGEPYLEKVGRRPGRAGGPRVEREGRVVHAYGHGGAGFTLARGCAESVAALAGL